MTRRSERSPALEELYRKIGSVSQGGEQLALLGEAILVAEESQDEDSLYELRCAMVEAANFADDAESQVAAFSWVLDKHLADPARFPTAVARPVYTDIAWTFKWVLSTLLSNSAIQRDQLEATLEAMEDLYRRHGFGTSATTYLRLCAAERLGDLDQLLELQQRFEALPRDRYSDCAACTPNGLASADLALGDAKRAIKRGKQLVKSRRSCLSEPELLLSQLLVPLLLEGDTTTAAEYFRRCRDRNWPEVSDRLSATGELLAMAAITGNVALGLDLLERRLPDLITVIHDHRNRLGFFTGCALLLERADKAGHGSRPVRDSTGVLSAQAIATETTVAALAAEFWQAAHQLAVAFDAASGNQSWQARIEQRRALTSVEVPLDLGFEDPGVFLITAEPEPTTAAEWLLWAEERHLVGDLDGALKGVDTALELGELEGLALVDALSARAWRKALQAQSRAGVSSVETLPPSAREEFDLAYRGYEDELRAQGRSDRLRVAAARGVERYDLERDPEPEDLIALLESLRSEEVAWEELDGIEYELSHALLQRDRVEEAITYVRSAQEHGLIDANAADAARTRLAVADLLFRMGEPDAATELGAVIDGPDPNRSVRAAALRLRAYAHARAGDFEAGESDAREAVQLYLQLAAEDLAAVCLALQAGFAEERGDLGRAVDVTRRALELVERLESFDSIQLRFDLGRRLTIAGQAEQAVAVLWELDRALLASGEQEGSEVSYDCAYWLGTALRDNQDPDEAIEVWQAALEVAVRRGDEAAVVVFGRAVGGIFAAYSEWAQALEAFEAARAAATDETDVAQLHERIGFVRCLSGDAEGLEEIRLAIESATELGLPIAVADWTDTLARALASLEQTDEAIAAALESSDLFAAAGEAGGRLGELELAVRLLANAGRTAEAIALLAPVLAEDSEEPGLEALRELRDELGGR